MKQIDLTNVEATQGGDYARPQAGGYIIQIKAVLDVPEKEYLKISYDIADGEFKGYYTDMWQRTGYDLPTFIKSYKDKALGYFKAFIDAVEGSNRYKWNNDERSLVNLFVGTVLREEEYRSRDGEIKTILKPDIFLTVSDIRNGKFEVRPCKRLTNAPASPQNGFNGMGAVNYTPQTASPQTGAQTPSQTFVDMDVYNDGGVPF